MAFAAIGNMIGGVPREVSWHLLSGGAVLITLAIQDWIKGRPE